MQEGAAASSLTVLKGAHPVYICPQSKGCQDTLQMLLLVSSTLGIVPIKNSCRRLVGKQLSTMRTRTKAAFSDHQSTGTVYHRAAPKPCERGRRRIREAVESSAIFGRQLLLPPNCKLTAVHSVASKRYPKPVLQSTSSLMLHSA
jgi:hypothetical protein